MLRHSLSRCQRQSSCILIDDKLLSSVINIVAAPNKCRVKTCKRQSDDMTIAALHSRSPEKRPFYPARVDDYNCDSTEEEEWPRESDYSCYALLNAISYCHNQTSADSALNFLSDNPFVSAPLPFSNVRTTVCYQKNVETDTIYICICIII